MATMRTWRVSIAGSAWVRTELLVEATCKSDAGAVARHEALHGEVQFEVELDDDLRVIHVERLSKEEAEKLETERRGLTPKS